MLADVVTQRSEKGFNFGVFLIPEGLIEFIPEVAQLISELNDILAQDVPHGIFLSRFPLPFPIHSLPPPH